VNGSLILSLFPGAIDMQGRALEELGYCVVRGPDKLWGGDIATFHPPRGVFAGVIGGDPCQTHMRLAQLNRALGRAPKWPDLTGEFCRCVGEAEPPWWLRENVPDAPDPIVDGYIVQKLHLNNRWVGGVQSRDRYFWFGSRTGLRILPEIVALEELEYESAIIGGHGGGLAKDGHGYDKTAKSVEKMQRDALRSIARRCELQGLPADFLDHAPWTIDAKRSVLANAPPLALCRAIAVAVDRATREHLGRESA
jgi:DNA (cytosine-5)-methyltransferase 1